MIWIFLLDWKEKRRIKNQTKIRENAAAKMECWHPFQSFISLYSYYFTQIHCSSWTTNNIAQAEQITQKKQFRHTITNDIHNSNLHIKQLLVANDHQLPIYKQKGKKTISNWNIGNLESSSCEIEPLEIWNHQVVKLKTYLLLWRNPIIVISFVPLWAKNKINIPPNQQVFLCGLDENKLSARNIQNIMSTMGNGCKFSHLHLDDNRSWIFILQDNLYWSNRGNQ